MRACFLLLSSLALVTLAQKVPVTCDWEKEQMCPGEWDPKSNQQITADFCIPNKVGDCMNFCPMKCGENDVICPGKMGHDGCKMADFCNGGKFCPVDCDWSKELICGGDWDPKTGQQMSADYCIPNKNGDCPASCPAKCGENDVICPGKMGGPGGCQNADYCHHGKFCPVDCDWSKEMSCPGFWDPKTGDQLSPDTCMPRKVGDCANHCPMKCGENDIMCPGQMDPAGCKMPDTCHPGKFCPANCDWGKEQMCPGEWDPKSNQQITAEFCIPMKVGDCMNHCPMKCGNNDMMMCPGKMDPNGCKMPDTCHSGKFCPVNCDWEKERMCPGIWDHNAGGQMTPDTCIPNKVGDCVNHCPMHCGKDMICPGKMDNMGCKMPDMCFPTGKECPKM